MRSILSPNISFNVKRGKPEVVVPAKPTPDEVKFLSDIDDQANLRHVYGRGVHVYYADPCKGTIDPANVIKEALSKALVFYYPIAGRLREQSGGRLVVNCNGEGVMFVEAEADMYLDNLEDLTTASLCFFDQLLFDSELIDRSTLDQPLLYIQVTRFKCGGFTFGNHISHNIVDAQGHAQFLIAIGELARGASQPSVLPVWDRHLLLAQDLPAPTHIHREYEPIEGAEQEQCDDVILKTPPMNLVHRSFFFGPSEISALRKRVPVQQFSNVSRFELITAAVWRSRTIALDYSPEFEVRLLIQVNLREKMFPPLRTGYYGNAYARAVAFGKAEKLCSSPLDYALKLVKEAIARATSSDFLQSFADMLVLRRRPRYFVARSFTISKVAHSGFKDVDFGWGEGVYCTKPASGFKTYYSSVKNSTGEEIVVVTMCLPDAAMARFEKEMENLIQAHCMNKQFVQRMIRSQI